ncbi:hypothetical protein DESC_720164 [Desulfosarcina cetonica]|nr:hypothetical protein DESC_720164 [Desulfosarcina cetonica]
MRSTGRLRRWCRPSGDCGKQVDPDGGILTIYNRYQPFLWIDGLPQSVVWMQSTYNWNW